MPIAHLEDKDNPGFALCGRPMQELKGARHCACPTCRKMIPKARKQIEKEAKIASTGQGRRDGALGNAGEEEGRLSAGVHQAPGPVCEVEENEEANQLPEMSGGQGREETEKGG